MEYTARRVRSVQRYLIGVAPEQEFRIVLAEHETDPRRLLELGFAVEPLVEQTVLPDGLNARLLHNIEGGQRVRRDLPMETAYREGEITDWHGYSHTVQIPYRRYPREPIPPPRLEWEALRSPTGEMYIASPVIANTVQNAEIIKHAMNMFAATFGKFMITKPDLEPVVRLIRRVVNWEILPPGDYPWDRIQGIVREANASRDPQEQALIEQRIQAIVSYGPASISVGQRGLRGYIAFSFPERDIHVLENMSTGNATYVLGPDWEELSRLTKGEILEGNRHRARIVHTVNWQRQIQQLLGN